VERDGEHVVIGEIGRPVGLGGEVRVWLHNPESDQLEQETPIELLVGDGPARAVSVVELRYAGGQAVVRFEGVESRENAEALRGGVLRVARESLAEPEEGEFYVWDLERCRVTLAGQPLGRVARVLPYPTCDVIVVERPDGSSVEVPLHEDFVQEIRLADTVIDLRTIDGLG
jgi:16S rRNA processing protein RimM